VCRRLLLIALPCLLALPAAQADAAIVIRGVYA